MASLGDLEILMRPAVLGKDHALLNSIAVMVAATYSAEQFKEVFGRIITVADDRDLDHFWLGEECPCGGDPLYHLR